MKKRILSICIVITYILNSITWLVSFIWGENLNGKALSNKQISFMKINGAIREVSEMGFLVCVFLLHLFVLRKVNESDFGKEIRNLGNVYIILAVCMACFMIINYIFNQGLVMNYFELILLMSGWSAVFAIILMIKSLVGRRK